jgi:hypothetical protein
MPSSLRRSFGGSFKGSKATWKVSGRRASTACHPAVQAATAEGLAVQIKPAAVVVESEPAIITTSARIP